MLADSYATRTGKGKDEMAALMDAETWFTADEAIAIGLADKKAETKAKNAWNLSAYDKAPPPDPESKDTPEEPAAAGFFMSTANANRLRLALIA
jgi:ATP-dependent Clp protease protease subunit